MNATTRTRIARRLVSLALASSALVGLTFGQAAPVAAVSTGQFSPPIVTCNWRYHSVSLIAAASPAPGFASQAVHYRYWFKDLTTGTWVPGLDPTTYGVINAVAATTLPNGWSYVNQGTTWSIQSTVAVPARHPLIVVVEYQWLINGTWYGQYTRAAEYHEYGYTFDYGNGTTRYDACYA